MATTNPAYSFQAQNPFRTVASRGYHASGLGSKPNDHGQYDADYRNWGDVVVGTNFENNAKVQGANWWTPTGSTGGTGSSNNLLRTWKLPEASGSFTKFASGLGGVDTANDTDFGNWYTGQKTSATNARNTLSTAMPSINRIWNGGVEGDLAKQLGTYSSTVGGINTRMGAELGAANDARYSAATGLADTLGTDLKTSRDAGYTRALTDLGNWETQQKANRQAALTTGLRVNDLGANRIASRLLDAGAANAPMAFRTALGQQGEASLALADRNAQQTILDTAEIATRKLAAGQQLTAQEINAIGAVNSAKQANAQQFYGQQINNTMAVTGADRDLQGNILGTAGNNTRYVQGAQLSALNPVLQANYGVSDFEYQPVARRLATTAGTLGNYAAAGDANSRLAFLGMDIPGVNGPQYVDFQPQNRIQQANPNGNRGNGYNAQPQGQQQPVQQPGQTDQQFADEWNNYWNNLADPNVPLGGNAQQFYQSGGQVDPYNSGYGYMGDGIIRSPEQQAYYNTESALYE